MRHKHIHHLLNDTVFNVETHPGKTTKALFIWHEKYMAPFVCALSCRLCFRSSSLFYIDFTLLSCSLFFCRSIFSYFSLLSIRTHPGSTTLLFNSTVDPHTTWIDYSSYRLNCRSTRSLDRLLFLQTQLTD